MRKLIPARRISMRKRQISIRMPRQAMRNAKVVPMPHRLEAALLRLINRTPSLRQMQEGK